MGYFDPEHPTLLADPVSARDHIRGSSSGSITLVEYGDFACPYCAAAHGLVKALLAEVSDLCFVFRANPRSHLFVHAAEAAEAAEAAGAQGKFWEMHDLLFENQSTLSSEEIRRHAAKLELDLARFDTELKAGTYRPRVRAQEISGWHSHVLSTPTFFIDGVRFEDSPTLLPAAVTQALGKKQRAQQKRREVQVSSTDNLRRQTISVGPHQLISDLPADDGGTDQGPDPHELLLGALGACTAMTVKGMAHRDHIPLRAVDVRLSRSKTGKEHVIRRSIELHGDLTDEQREKLLKAADRCPVSRTLAGAIAIETRLVSDSDRIVDEASEESFPASDPPSWNLGR